MIFLKMHANAVKFTIVRGYVEENIASFNILVFPKFPSI
jgi:hypothetical protein